MVLTFNKTVAIKNNKLSCLYYSYIVIVTVGFVLWCFIGHTMEEQSVTTSSTSDVVMHVQLSVPSVAAATLDSSTLGSNGADYGALCDAAQASDNHTCSATVSSCAGLPVTCLADRDANFQESAREAFIATSFELTSAAASTQNHHKGILTTADVQSVNVQYMVMYPDRDMIETFLRGIFRNQELARASEKTSIRDDTALTVVLDSADTVWSRITGSDALAAGGIRFTLPELLELSGAVSSSDRSSWLATLLAGLDLDIHVSCYDEPSSDDVESRDIWDGPTCYIQVLRNTLRSDSGGTRFNAMRWSGGSAGIVENHLSWHLKGVRIRADISRTLWEVSAGRVLLHIVVFTLLIWIGKWILYYIIRNCLGRLSVVYRHALSEPFSILGEVASATVESVVQGLCYREMDGDNLLDGEGNVPLKSIETQIQQLVRSMQPMWTDEEVAAFTALAVHSLMAKDPQSQELQRCWKCLGNLCCWKFWVSLCCPRVRPDVRTTQSIPMDRFVAASSQQKVSRIEVLGDLFRKGSGRCTFLERVFTPKEVQDRQWVLTEEERAKQNTPDTGVERPSGAANSETGTTMLAAALEDEEQAPQVQAAKATSKRPDKSLKVRISSAPQDPDGGLESSPSQAGRARTSISAALMPVPVSMMSRLKQPASSVQMSTRSFAAQLADMDRSILQMLTQVEDKHTATLGSWRSKATLMAERIDSMETSLRTLEEQLIDDHSDRANNSERANTVTPPPSTRAATRIGRAGMDGESLAQLENLRLDTDALDKRLDTIEDMLNLQQMAFSAGGGKKAHGA